MYGNCGYSLEHKYLDSNWMLMDVDRTMIVWSDKWLVSENQTFDKQNLAKITETKQRTQKKKRDNK